MVGVANNYKAMEMPQTASLAQSRFAAFLLLKVPIYYFYILVRYAWSILRLTKFLLFSHSNLQQPDHEISVN